MLLTLIPGKTKLQQTAVNGKARLNPLQWTGKDIVEYILLLCAGDETFDNLMQWMISSSPMVLKKYLLYLITILFHIVDESKSII
jgi:hypothetical protein